MFVWRCLRGLDDEVGDGCGRIVGRYIYFLDAEDLLMTSSYFLRYSLLLLDRRPILVKE